MNYLDVSIEQEVADVRMKRPHVVILGAGASRAACLGGDKNGNTLPLMSDFVRVTKLGVLLEKWMIDISLNFEEIFSNLHTRGEWDKINEIEKIVEEYFVKLKLPDEPTVYDLLVLSLREKDLIATFNWDPLLMQAYLRNRSVGLKLPRLAFLHGNVSVGYCEKDKIAGLAGGRCKKCREVYKPTPLLYPIKKKDYAKDLFIASEWNALKKELGSAFMITIFGYSGPKTDEEAIGLMKQAWGDKYQRNMEQTAFITTQDEEDVLRNWEPFIHTHHYEISTSFYDSWIANHPRRTGEAYINQYIDAKFINNNNKIPDGANFSVLWRWFDQFKDAER